MRYKTVAVIDYGMGNHASVIHSLNALGYIVKVSADIEVLDHADVLLLPGVGAFPAAMHELHQRGLVDYLQEQADRQRPILGICLGMQLFSSGSYEHGYTHGLDLIPGVFTASVNQGWHIGWNTINCTQHDPLILACDGEAFYFNHSFYYQGPGEYQLAVAHHSSTCTAIIRRGSVIGLQFHPEKSQGAGKKLLHNLITGLTNA